MARSPLLFLLGLALTWPVAATGAADRAVVAKARQMAGEIQAAVSQLRGLPVRRKLKTDIYSQADLRTFIVGQLSHKGGRKHLALRSRALRALGALPPDFELLGGMTGLLDEQVAGLYDPGSRKLRIMARLVPMGEEVWSPLELLTGSPTDRARFVLAHEIVHALQDQHYNLRHLGRDRRGESDLETALASLFEGDATAAGLAFMIADRGGYDEVGFFATANMMAWMMKGAMSLASLGLLPDTAKLRATPKLLQQRLIFPYVGGLSMCMKAGQAGGWPAIDALYRDPPLSTEQVLHPRKLLGKQRDYPQVLKLPDLRRTLGRPYALRYTDTLGELGVRTLLEDAPAGVDAAQAAAGWDGDRYVLYGAKGRPDVLVWLSTWDSPEEAAEFAGALARWMALRHATDARLDVRGADVLVQLGVAPASHGVLRDRIWRHTKRRERRRLP